jgi:D-mannonate dehydratase
VYDKLGGVPRIFNNFSEIKERLAAANSPNIGMILCCGVWLEGGAAMGCTPEEAVRWFTSNNRAWQIHFRNVSSTLPKFNEAFEDNGYYDMYKIMKAVYDSGYRELIHFDHTPQMAGAPYAYPAFAVGYMHALYQRAAAGSSIGRSCDLRGRPFRATTFIRTSFGGGCTCRCSCTRSVVDVVSWSTQQPRSGGV